MNFAFDQKGKLPFVILVVIEAEGLSAVKHKLCEGKILHHNMNMSKSVKLWLIKFDTGNVSIGWITSKREDVSSAVQQLCEIIEMPVDSGRAWFGADILALAAHFFKIIRSSYIRLRLNVVAMVSSNKIHVDGVRARLICIYKGLGTQIGDTQKDGKVDLIEQLVTGARMILPKSLWPGNAKAELMHRSTPTENLEKEQLLLILDAMDILEDNL